MATATGQPPPREVGVITVMAEVKKISYANTIIAPTTPYQAIPRKPITYLYGEPKIV